MMSKYKKWKKKRKSKLVVNYTGVKNIKNVNPNDAIKKILEKQKKILEKQEEKCNFIN
jgi:hypothetical protein